ncbi:MAG: hypothetical protein J0L63_18470 [Anaerolineae bacterium]|nr:hypothetical protein [Anaerolineae bacterium]
MEEPHPYARLVARSLSQRGTKAGVHDEGVFVVVVGVVADKETRREWAGDAPFFVGEAGMREIGADNDFPDWQVCGC